MTSPLKPGVKTSEFFLTVAGMTIANVMASGLLIKTHWATQLVAAVGNFIMPALYALFRSQVKVSQLQGPV